MVVGDLIVVCTLLVMIVVDSIFSVVANSSKLLVVSFSDEGNRLSRFNLLMLKPQTYTVNMVETTEVH